MILQRQFLEVTDFSGGMTENYIPGSPTQFRRGDNLLLLGDKRLESRWGSEIYGETNSLLPTSGKRISALIPFDTESELFGTSSTRLFYQNPTDWADLTGPSGNAAFPSNTAESSLSWAEWQHHLFLTTDSGNRPIKIYRDENDDLQLRQAGLPKPELGLRYTDSQKLSLGIILAFDIRNKLLGHVQDVGAIGVGLHLVEHTAVKTALQALTPPSTAAQLAAYAATLKTQYDAHITDARALGFIATYHMAGTDYGDTPILNFKANATLAAATDLDTAIAVLNDLRDRYNWHTYALNTHGTAYKTVTTGFGIRTVTAAKVEQVTGAIFDPNLGTLLTFVNNFRTDFNTHVSEDLTGLHNSADTSHAVVAPAATDMHSVVTLLAHLYWQYWRHYASGNIILTGGTAGTAALYSTFTGTAAGASATFTVTSLDGSLLVGRYFIKRHGGNPFVIWNYTAAFGVTNPVTVTGGTANTIIFSTVVTSSNGASTYVVSTQKVHYDLDRDTNAIIAPSNVTDIFEGSLASDGVTEIPATIDLGLVGSGLNAFSDIFSSVYTRLKAHALSGLLRDSDTPYSCGQDPYNVLGSLGGTAPTVTQWIPHTPGSSGKITFPEIIRYTTVDGEVTDGYTLFPEAKSYLYRFLYANTYFVGDVEHLDRGAPTDATQVWSFESAQEAAPSTAAVYPISLTGLPVLANDALTHWPTASVKLEIYRTTGNFLNYFKAGEVTNGTTTFTDSMIDEFLIEGEPLYTTGGVVANDEPPIAKAVHILGNTGYYGNVVENGVNLPARVRQSIQNDPDSCPASFYDDMDDVVIGISSHRNYPLVFCMNSFYRLEGQFNELGQGQIAHERLSDKVGCVSKHSIVQTEVGVFFAGTNGFYWTDGFQFLMICEELQMTYLSLIQTARQKRRISGAYDSKNRRIWWTLQTTDGAYNNACWILDLNFGLTKNMPFTTASGTSFRPSALTFMGFEMLRGDEQGYLFRHREILTSDPTIDTAVDPSTWLREAVIYDYRSCALNFGTNAMRKYGTRISVQARDRSNLSLQINTNQDDGRTTGALKPIRSRTNCLWGDPRFVWGDPDFRWTYDRGIIDEFRRFPSNTLRFDYRQVQFTNAYVVITSSDERGTGEVDDVGKTLTLDSNVWLWPTDIVGFVVTIGGVEYVIEERINDLTLLLTDPDDQLSDLPAFTDLPWVIHGIPRNERLHLIGYTMQYSLLGDNQSAFTGAESGENA